MTTAKLCTISSHKPYTTITRHILVIKSMTLISKKSVTFAKEQNSSFTAVYNLPGSLYCRNRWRPVCSHTGQDLDPLANHRHSAPWMSLATEDRLYTITLSKRQSRLIILHYNCTFHFISNYQFQL